MYTYGDFKQVVRFSDGIGNVFEVVHVGFEFVPFVVAMKVYQAATREWLVVNSWTFETEQEARTFAFGR